MPGFLDFLGDALPNSVFAKLGKKPPSPAFMAGMGDAMPRQAAPGVVPGQSGEPGQRGVMEFLGNALPTSVFGNMSAAKRGQAPAMSRRQYLQAQIDQMEETQRASAGALQGQQGMGK